LRQKFRQRPEFRRTHRGEITRVRTHNGPMFVADEIVIVDLTDGGVAGEVRDDIAKV